MYKFLMGSMLLVLALLLSACSTVGGVGEDIQTVGEVITDEAKETKEDIKEEIEKDESKSTY